MDVIECPNTELQAVSVLVKEDNTADDKMNDLKAATAYIILANPVEKKQLLGQNREAVEFLSVEVNGAFKDSKKMRAGVLSVEL